LSSATRGGTDELELTLIDQRKFVFGGFTDRDTVVEGNNNNCDFATAALLNIVMMMTMMCIALVSVLATHRRATGREVTAFRASVTPSDDDVVADDNDDSSVDSGDERQRPNQQHQQQRRHRHPQLSDDDWR
jgi:hypothetical protein